MPFDVPQPANAVLYDPAQVEEYLKTLFRNVDWLEGELISVLGIGEKGTAQEGVFRERKIVPPAFVGSVHTHFKRWAGAYVASFVVPAVLSARAGEDYDVTRDKVLALPAIILDLDSGDTQAKARFVAEALGEPSMVVASGGTTETGNPKLHLYWVFNEPSEEVDKVANLRKILAAKVGGDQSFGRATQVVRVAGTVHAKNGNPSVCRIIHRNAKDYSLDDLAETIAAMLPMPGIEPPAPKEQLPITLPGGIMDFTPSQNTAVAVLHRDIHEGGDGEQNRWASFNMAAGFKIAEARAGRISLQNAYEQTYGWMLQHMKPVWPDARFSTEFQGLLERDIQNHGPMANTSIVAPTVPVSASGGELEPERWIEPTPLPHGLPPVAEFDPRILPGPLRDWVTDIAERMQAPAEFIGVPAMVAAGALAGRKIGVRPQEHTDWHEVPNVWGCIVGRPSVMKSPSMRQALAPLHRLEAEAREDHARRLAAFQAAQIERELRGDACKMEMKRRLRANLDADVSDLTMAATEEPKAVRYLVNDGSYQALTEVLRNCAPNGVLAFRDELMSLLRGLDDENRADERGFYLTGWNGLDSYTSDRITRGLNLHIPAVTMSLLGSTQPGKIVDYVASAIAGGRGDDGLVQRFGMFVWPDLPPNWQEVDRQPCRIVREGAFKAFDRLAAITPAEVDAQADESQPDRPFLRFDPEAQHEFKSWRKDLEFRLRSDDLHPALESHLAKYRKLVPSLALLHHLLSGARGPIGTEALITALAWSEFLETHAQRLYGAALDKTTSNAGTILKRIKKGDLSATFTRRELQQKGWTGLTDPTAVDMALERLEAHNFIRIEKHHGSKGGRPSIVCTVNPMVLGQ